MPSKPSVIMHACQLQIASSENLFAANGCWAGLLESGGLCQILVSLAIEIMQRFKDMTQHSKP
ncbi:Unknown protein sequence [Pseudomonas syringae pv. maculicola]|nr:Unknown protein sequence [Pseudomonas syringae pv. maculicola]MBM0213139.1 hypothetical protein [Pseudomonas syringae pv. maculicola]